MSYRVEQDFEYVGNHYWHWRAWIEADRDELDKVQEVVWILHPSFVKNLIRVKDSSNKFELKTSGWGTFLLRAEIILHSGAKQMLTHKLKLEYPESASETSSTKTVDVVRTTQPRVYLSYGMLDSHEASKVRADLTKAGYYVLDQTHIEPSDSSTDAVKAMISKADAVVGVVGENDISPWVSLELEAAVAANTSAFVFLSPQASSVGFPKGVNVLKFDEGGLNASVLTQLLRE